MATSAAASADVKESSASSFEESKSESTCQEMHKATSSSDTPDGSGNYDSEDGNCDSTHTLSQEPVRKYVRRSRTWVKNVRKRRMNAGKRYLLGTTKKVVSFYNTINSIKLNVSWLWHVY